MTKKKRDVNGHAEKEKEAMCRASATISTKYTYTSYIFYAPVYNPVPCGSDLIECIWPKSR